MAERASGHMRRGCWRRSAVAAIHAISPCRSRAMNSCSRTVAGQASSTEANRQASKPSSAALARISSLLLARHDVVSLLVNLDALPKGRGVIVHQLLQGGVSHPGPAGHQLG